MSRTVNSLAPSFYETGFTLIELSIVLVIIGLITGGILTGRDLIDAASVRAQIAQIEKYNTAVHAFQGKYDGLPGDLLYTNASQFGFVARAGGQARGDGNGIIEGINYGGPTYHGWYQTGEPYFFWEDLGSAGLIGGSYSMFVDGATPTVYPSPASGSPSTTLSYYVPLAKIGQANYVYVYSNNGTHYFTIASPIVFQSDGNNKANLTMSVHQAYNIDAKSDDGLPQSGNVTAQYIYLGYVWAAPGNPSSNSGPYTTATAGSSSTCYDNGNAAGVAQKYSVGQSGGTGPNCALSFRFQ